MFLSPPFPLLASSAYRLVPAHAPFRAPVPSSFPALDASVACFSYNNRTSQESSVTYGVPADFASINTAFPTTDPIASIGAHADTGKQIWCHHQHLNHEQGVPAVRTWKSQKHAWKRCDKFLLFADVVRMVIRKARKFSSLLMIELTGSKWRYWDTRGLQGDILRLTRGEEKWALWRQALAKPPRFILVAP